MSKIHNGTITHSRCPLQTAVRALEETLCWLCSCCSASPLGSAAAVGRRFSRRKPPLLKRSRYRREVGRYPETRRSWSASEDSDPSLSLQCSPVAVHPPPGGPVGPCPPYNTPGQPGVVRFSHTDTCLYSVELNTALLFAELHVHRVGWAVATCSGRKG